MNKKIFVASLAFAAASVAGSGTPDSFRYCFFAHRYLQHHRNCIPLFLGYMFAHLQLFFLWTDN